MTLSGYGGVGYGTGPWGMGVWLGFGVMLASTQTENSVRITFTDPVYSDGLGSPNDALEVSHYTINPVGGTGLDGNVVRPVNPVKVELVEGDPYSVDVFTDRPLSPHPCTYQVGVVGLKDLAGILLTPGNETFLGLHKTIESAVRNNAIRGRDIGAPPAVSDAYGTIADPVAAVMGVFNVDTTGDYAFDEGITSYKKRILRKIFCRKRRFIFLPKEWGLGVQDEIKKGNTPDQRERLRSEIEIQVLAEPDTGSCTVTTVPLAQSKSVVLFRIVAIMRDGRGVQIDAPFDASGG